MEHWKCQVNELKGLTPDEIRSQSFAVLLLFASFELEIRLKASFAQRF